LVGGVGCDEQAAAGGEEKSGRFLSERNRLADSSISLPATEIGWLAARHRFLSQHLSLYGLTRPVRTTALDATSHACRLPCGVQRGTGHGGVMLLRPLGLPQ